MIVVIDNYDSFTYNMVQYIGEMTNEISVKRNDEWTIEEIENSRPKLIVISPGPCTPTEAGISLDTVKHFAGKVPIFGVCLGHQVIAEAFGAQIISSPELHHGKTSAITHDGKTIYDGLPDPLTVMRYHSLTVHPKTLPACLEVSAQDEGKEIMGIRHHIYPIEGSSFIRNLCSLAKGKRCLKIYYHNIFHPKEKSGAVNVSKKSGTV